jgi:hypothetical protein
LLRNYVEPISGAGGFGRIFSHRTAENVVATKAALKNREIVTVNEIINSIDESLISQTGKGVLDLNEKSGLKERLRVIAYLDERALESYFITSRQPSLYHVTRM